MRLKIGNISLRTDNFFENIYCIIYRVIKKLPISKGITVLRNKKCLIDVNPKSNALGIKSIFIIY